MTVTVAAVVVVWIFGVAGAIGESGGGILGDVGIGGGGFANAHARGQVMRRYLSGDRASGIDCEPHAKGRWVGPRVSSSSDSSFSSVSSSLTTLKSFFQSAKAVQFNDNKGVHRSRINPDTTGATIHDANPATAHITVGFSSKTTHQAAHKPTDFRSVLLPVRDVNWDRGWGLDQECDRDRDRDRDWDRGRVRSRGSLDWGWVGVLTRRVGMIGGFLIAKQLSIYTLSLETKPNRGGRAFGAGVTWFQRLRRLQLQIRCTSASAQGVPSDGGTAEGDNDEGDTDEGNTGADDDGDDDADDNVDDTDLDTNIDADAHGKDSYADETSKKHINLNLQNTSQLMIDDHDFAMIDEIDDTGNVRMKEQLRDIDRNDTRTNSIIGNVLEKVDVALSNATEMIQPEGQAQGQGQGEGRSVEDIGGDSSKGSSKGSSLVKGEEHPFCPPSVPPGSSKHGVKAVIKRGVGYIFLDRGEKLNAVNSIMLTRLGDILTEWYAEERVRAVVMKSTTSRAFSAGGDVARILSSLGNETGTGSELEYGDERHRDEHNTFAKSTLLQEYQVLLNVHNFPKPVVAIADGITMGFGAGLAAAADAVIVSENTLFAMPECKIGFLPDAGYAYHAVRSKAGVWPAAVLGLSGMSVGRNGSYGASDLIAVGIGTHYIQHDRIAELEKEIIESVATSPSEEVEKEVFKAIRRTCHKNLPKPETIIIKKELENILQKCSSASSALERLQWVATFNTESQFDPVAFQDGVPSQHLKQFAKRALQSAQRGSAFCQEAWWTHLGIVNNAYIRNKVLGMSPSKRVFTDTNRPHIGRVKHSEMPKMPALEAVLAREYAVGICLLDRRDFREGVRTVVVEKNKDVIPDFQPKTLNQSVVDLVRSIGGPENAELMVRNFFEVLRPDSNF